MRGTCRFVAAPALDHLGCQTHVRSRAQVMRYDEGWPGTVPAEEELGPAIARSSAVHPGFGVGIEIELKLVALCAGERHAHEMPARSNGDS